MSNFAEMKKAFFKEVVAHGIYDSSQFREAFPLGYTVPNPTMQKWFKKFRKVEDGFSAVARNVNHFKLGADPEFVFAWPQNSEGAGDIMHAHGLHLKQGPAFGEDNNGRLAEIRPYPSRSALEVCASVLSTLRWMAILKPDTNYYQWVAGAYLYRDGLGGHVHFGRKRPTRGDEVRALDNLMELLLNAGVYPVKEVMARRAGDARGQLYGRPGDFRMQNHGYEYRTFPSWLDSPALAFLTLTLSKLTVHDPGIVLAIQQLKSGRISETIMNLLAYYRDLDDDARLAHLMCQRGIPVHLGGDFRGRWGLPIPATIVAKNKPVVIPMSIAPSKDDTQEMMTHLKTGAGVVCRVPVPTWTPTHLPAGYKMVIEHTDTLQKKGLGELIWDVCQAEIGTILFTSQAFHSPQAAVVSGSLVKTRDPMKEFGTELITLGGGSKPSITFNSSWLEGGKAKLLKRWLLCGALPIWKAKDVKTSSYAEWREKFTVDSKKPCKENVVYHLGERIV